jgi:hypothetical protein
MRRVHTTHADLRRIFESSITIRDIAEPLVTFDAERTAGEAKPFLDARDFDVTGVRQNGRVLGYAWRTRLTTGCVGDHMIPFHASDIVPEGEPLVKAFKGLKGRHAFFVTAFGQVAGIVTVGDLQKGPVRMWLFGLVSLIEMQMLRLIREQCPDGAWERFFKSSNEKKRLGMARGYFDQHNKRNEAIDLASCLLLSDKAKVFQEEPTLKELLSDIENHKAFFAELVGLRNNLAHAQDIIGNEWPALPKLVERAERLLTKLEQGGTLA